MTGIETAIRGSPGGSGSRWAATDLYAEILEYIDNRPRIEVWQLATGTVGVNVGRWIELAAELLRADLEQHKPDYCGGCAEYEEHDEEAFDRNGRPLGTYVTVRSKIPNPPDWCDTCSERTPCRHVRDLAAKLAPPRPAQDPPSTAGDGFAFPKVPVDLRPLFIAVTNVVMEELRQPGHRADLVEVTIQNRIRHVFEGRRP